MFSSNSEGQLDITKEEGEKKKNNTYPLLYTTIHSRLIKYWNANTTTITSTNNKVFLDHNLGK